MCFTKKIGMNLNLSGIDRVIESLFSEESGFVVQVKQKDITKIITTFTEKGLVVREIGHLTNDIFQIRKHLTSVAYAQCKGGFIVKEILKLIFNIIVIQNSF